VSCLPFPNQDFRLVAEPANLLQVARMNGTLTEAWGQNVRETPPRATVLVVDDEDVHLDLVEGILKPEGYSVLTSTCPQRALRIVNEDSVDLVILDMMMPGMDGLSFCRRVREHPRSKLVQVLMLTGLAGLEQDSIESGADEFMEKPYAPETLKSRVRAMLRHRSAIERLEEAESILFALAVAVEQRDRCTSGHCERLAMYSVALGMKLRLEPKQLLALYRGGYLHDIGKIGMPDSILFKPGKLSESDWVTMRTHPVLGENICKPMRCLWDVLPIIRSHHERWDGSGYPDRLKHDQIPLLARILQLADVFDALTTRRPYKEALTTAEALQVMEYESEQGWYEPDMMALFMDIDHEALRQAVEAHSSTTKDLESMKRSLIHLNLAVG
jgi:putative two-component system response regulator